MYDMETTSMFTSLVPGLILTLFSLDALFFKLFKPKMNEKALLIINTFKDTGYLLYFI